MGVQADDPRSGPRGDGEPLDPQLDFELIGMPEDPVPPSPDRVLDQLLPAAPPQLVTVTESAAIGPLADISAARSLGAAVRSPGRPGRRLGALIALLLLGGGLGFSILFGVGMLLSRLL